MHGSLYVCARVYRCICMEVYMYVRVFIGVYAWKFICMCDCLYVFMHGSLYVCARVYRCICMEVYMYVRVFIGVYAWKFICMCACL